MSALIDAISAELEKYRPIEETAVEPKVEPKVEPEHLTEAKECSTRQSKISKLNAENKKNLSHTDVTSNPLSFNNEEVEQIEELSINTLASYKKKAGVEASNLDKASASIAAHGNHEWAKKYTNLANKRVSGVIKATKKQFKEEVQMKSFKEFNEVFADQGSGSDAKDNAEWEKRHNAAVKKKNDSIKKASTDKAMDQAIKDEMKEEFEQIEEITSNSQILKNALDRHEEHALAANKAGDHEKVKVHQKYINDIKTKLARITRLGEDIEQIEEKSAQAFRNKIDKNIIDVRRGERAVRDSGLDMKPEDTGHKTKYQMNKAAGRALRKEESEQVVEEVDVGDSDEASSAHVKHATNNPPTHKWTDDNDATHSVWHHTSPAGRKTTLLHTKEPGVGGAPIMKLHGNAHHNPKDIKKSMKDYLEEGAFSNGQLKPSKEALVNLRKTPSNGTLISKDEKGVYTAKTVNGKEVSRVYKTKEEKDVPWHAHSEYEVKFKKPKNPNRTGMDSARSLAQRAMAAAMAKKTVKEEVELDEGNDQYSVHATHPTSGVTRSVRSVRDPKESPNEMKERVQRDLKSQGFKVTHITKLGVQATDDNDSEPVEKGKKGAGRPSGSLSGARDRSKNGVRSSTGGLPTYALHLPNKNK